MTPQPADTIFSARGKIMLTGEYLVLEGARTLARPTLRRQFLHVGTQGIPGQLQWVSLDYQGKSWFEYTFRPSEPDFKLKLSQDPVAAKLWSLLDFNASLSGLDVVQPGYKVTTRLEWPRDWGLGSSSSLVVLLSRWFGSDPFVVQQDILGGSGYDIACGLSDEAIIYTLKEGQPKYQPVNTNPTFERHAAFAWLGSKADTDLAIRHFKQLVSAEDITDSIPRVDLITDTVLVSTDAQEMVEALGEHEAIIGSLIQREPIRHKHFKTFPGMVKSCGAWGGDFVLFLGREPSEAFMQKTASSYGLQLFTPAELFC